jgi:cytoskeletal protein CcmA (bactofilin family)
MAEIRIKDMDEHEIDTILAEDIDFEGHLTFKKPLMIKGKFKGEIKSTSALYIGEKAYVEATTEAAVVSSKGMHKGDIIGHSRVELFSTAQVEGDITTPDFVVESGCKFNGFCNMGGGTPAEAGTKPVVQAALAPAATPAVPVTPAAGSPPSAQPSASQPQQGPHAQGAHPQGHQQHGPQQGPHQGTGTPQGSGGQQK